MLNESSYFAAIYVYTGAAGALLLCLMWWLRRWRLGWASLVVLLTAALLLTPAYPKEGVATLAPALIVAVFQMFTEGIEAAEHALRPLAFMCAAAVAVALLLGLISFWRRPAPQAAESGEGEAAGN